MLDHPFSKKIQSTELISRTGRVVRILPTYLEADGPAAPLGTVCKFSLEDNLGGEQLAEIVSVQEQSIRLVPFTAHANIPYGAIVVAEDKGDLVPVGDAFAGRAIDGLGRPIDGLAKPVTSQYARFSSSNSSPLDRASPNKPLDTGVRAIDGLLSLDHGQRVGIFAAAGVGKTKLVTQINNQIAVDRRVICLVGERGREVEALWSGGLDNKTKAQSVLVAATSDDPAAMRVRAVHYAIALADHWRRQGLSVLLVLDSATRLAMALREIGLAAGEPPTVRAYTPSVFSTIPRLVERCGAYRNGGSITAVMTVLCEDDDVDDPISEMMKSLLDGHIVLSRSLAEQGHFPAIDIPRSLSRLASRLMSPAHRRAASHAVSVLAKYDEARTLIETGIYAAGSNPDIDRALKLRPALMSFLKQLETERSSFEDAQRQLIRIFEEGGRHAG